MDYFSILELGWLCLEHRISFSASHGAKTSCYQIHCENTLMESIKDDQGHRPTRNEGRSLPGKKSRLTECTCRGCRKNIMDNRGRFWKILAKAKWSVAETMIVIGVRVSVKFMNVFV